MGAADRASELMLASPADGGPDWLGDFHLERDFLRGGVHVGQIALTPHGFHEICKQRHSLGTGKSCHDQLPS